MKLKKINQEVFYCDEKIVKVGYRDIGYLKESAGGNKRKRIRLCAHSGLKDKQHEMFIVCKKDTYIRPHRHINKCESFHIIEGDAYVLLFTHKGDTQEIIRVGEYRNKKRFYCRIPKDTYHTIIIKSGWIVLHEVTEGPFRGKIDTIFAPWSPEETDLPAIEEFTAKILTKEAF